MRRITGEKRDPKLKVEFFNPVKFAISDPDPVPNYLRKAAEEGKTYRAAGVGHRMVEHDVSELVADYELRSYIMSGFAWIDFVIKNEGTCKATDISVEIEVPTGLMIYETTDLGMYTELTIPGSIIGNRKKSLHLEGVRAREGREEFPDGLFGYSGVDGWEADGCQCLTVRPARTLLIVGGNPIRKGLTSPPVASLGAEAVTLGLSVDS